jgi:hypothetical protein
MRPINPIICDAPGCGKTKGENNRWWSVIVSKVGIAVLSGSVSPNEPEDQLFDFCGEEHALAFVAKKMSELPR